MAYQYIEAPTVEKIKNDYSVFLAGGISNCEDWQKSASKALSQLDDLTVINPRREEWKMDKNEIEESTKQIAWEFAYIRKAKMILFWFTDDTLQPITLFELGSALQRNTNGKQKIFIGCDPNYKRMLDVKIQSKLIGFKGKIHNSLSDLIKDVADNYKSKKN